MLVDNIETQRKELDSLRKKNLEFSTNIVSHQRRLEELSTELSTAREELRKREALISNLTAEKEIIKANEARLSNENIHLQREKAQQQALFENLQTMVKTVEQNEATMKQRLLHDLESAQKERYKSGKLTPHSFDQHVIEETIT